MGNIKEIERRKKVESLIFQFEMIKRWEKTIIESNENKKTMTNVELNEFLKLFSSDITTYYHTMLLKFKDKDNIDETTEIINLSTLVDKENINNSFSLAFDITNKLFYILFFNNMKEKDIIYSILQKSKDYVSYEYLDKLPKIINYSVLPKSFTPKEMTKIVGIFTIVNTLLYYSANNFLKRLHTFVTTIPTKDNIDVMFYRKLAKKDKVTDINNYINPFERMSNEVNVIVSQIISEKSSYNGLLDFITELTAFDELVKNQGNGEKND